MGLEDTDAVIIVYNEAGKAVAFAVNQAVASCGRTPGKAVCLTKPEGTREHYSPEICTGWVIVKTEDADSDGANLIVAAGEELAVGRINAHHIPFSGVADYLGYGPGEYPGVETEDGFLPAGFQNDLIHCFPLFQDRVPLP